MIIDIILIALLLVFVLLGFWFGFIHTLGSLLGTFAGAFIAGLGYGWLAGVLENWFGHPNLMKIFAFIVLFLLIDRLIGFFFYIFDTIFQFLTIIPFLKTINRVLGIILGFIEGLLIVGLILFVIVRFPVSEWFTGLLQSSFLLPWFIKISGILQWILPEVLKNLEAVI